MVGIDLEDKKRENQQDFMRVCDYVKTDILQYTDDMKFPKYMVLRIRGLADGKFLANNHFKPQASYTYKTILYTFMFSKPKIINYIQANKNKINDEKHMINLIMKFVEEDINDVVMRLERKHKSEESIANQPLDNQKNNGADYVHKSTSAPDKLKNLW